MTAPLVQLTRRMLKLRASPYFELSMPLMLGIELPMLPMPLSIGSIGNSIWDEGVQFRLVSDHP